MSPVPNSGFQTPSQETRLLFPEHPLGDGGVALETPPAPRRTARPRTHCGVRLHVEKHVLACALMTCRLPWRPGWQLALILTMPRPAPPSPAPGGRRRETLRMGDTAPPHAGFLLHGNAAALSQILNWRGNRDSKKMKHLQFQIPRQSAV